MIAAKFHDSHTFIPRKRLCAQFAHLIGVMLSRAKHLAFSGG